MLDAVNERNRQKEEITFAMLVSVFFAVTTPCPCVGDSRPHKHQNTGKARPRNRIFCGFRRKGALRSDIANHREVPSSRGISLVESATVLALSAAVIVPSSCPSPHSILRAQWNTFVYGRVLRAGERAFRPDPMSLHGGVSAT